MQSVPDIRHIFSSINKDKPAKLCQHELYMGRVEVCNPARYKEKRYPTGDK